MVLKLKVFGFWVFALVLRENSGFHVMGERRILDFGVFCVLYLGILHIADAICLLAIRTNH